MDGQRAVDKCFHRLITADEMLVHEPQGEGVWPPLGDTRHRESASSEEGEGGGGREDEARVVWEEGGGRGSIGGGAVSVYLIYSCLLLNMHDS